MDNKTPGTLENLCLMSNKRSNGRIKYTVCTTGHITTLHLQYLHL